MMSARRSIAHLTLLTAVAALAAPVGLAPTARAEGPAAVPAMGAAAATDDPAPVLTAATFADPPASVRPKYRWWMPLAYTDDDRLEAELQQMKDSGAGGAEVAAFSVEGTGNNRNPFLETYGWGTPRWAEKVSTMYAAAQERDLSLDLTISPRWPATVPTVDDVNDPAAAQQLAYAVEFAIGGTAREGALPSTLSVTPPSGAEKTLVAVVAARCSDAACAGQTSKPRLLDRASVVDLTGEVRDGALSHTFGGDAAETWALIAFYQLPTGQALSGYTPTGTNYVLDPLSEEGARASTDFYDEAILTPGVRALLARMRSADFYEDSLEIGDTQKWTRSFVEEWDKRRGYSPITLLPALAGAGAQGLTSKPAFDFDDGSGDRVRTDYRQTWSDLYIANRLDVFREWAHRHGLQTRIQPYGHPIDVAEAAGHVDVPEGESLAFGQSVGAYSNVEDYKVVASGAHSAGAPVVSDECCAFSNQVWASTVADATDQSNLQAVYRGYAGGTNQMVWHGFPHLTRGPKDAGPQSTWPGMTYGNNTSWSEAFGADKNPSWQDYRSVNDNLARMQLVLRQGLPRFDAAVYWQDFGLAGTGTTGAGDDTLVPSDSAMAEAGYTWEYLSPAQLRSDNADYVDGALFPNHSGHRALVLKDQGTMPLDVAQRLLSLVQDGLPVVVVGQLPASIPGLDPSGEQDHRLAEVVTKIADQPTVVRVPSLDRVPAALAGLGVQPAASSATPSADILTVRRHTGTGDGAVDYYYLWNQTGATTYQDITLTGHGRPYQLDTWSGKITPVTAEASRSGRVTVPVRLAPHDAMVMAVTSRSDETFGGTTAEGSGTGTASGAAAPLSIDEWTLDVDSWTPGETGLPGDTAHTEIGPIDVATTESGALPAWSQIDPEHGYDVDLSDVSGIGTYTTRFHLDEEWSRVREADLDLGTAIDTVQVTVNGTRLDGINHADLGRIDLGDLLQPGTNTVTVRVASTLLNAVRVAPGSGASGRARMDYGLLGPVRVTPHTGAAPYLLLEPLEDRLPMADGGANVSRVAVTNTGPRPVDVRLTVDTTGDLRADLPGTIRVPARSTRVVRTVLRNPGAAEATTLALSARGSNGMTATASVHTVPTGNLAENTEETPFPRTLTDATQDRYPGFLATDGETSTFLVSFGRAAGQGPTNARPWRVGVDLGVPIEVDVIRVGGRSNYGARDYEIQVSDDGRHWRTIATVADAPKAGLTTTVEPVRTRYLRASITRAWDNGTDANVQMDEFEVYAAD